MITRTTKIVENLAKFDTDEESILKIDIQEIVGNPMTVVNVFAYYNWDLVFALQLPIITKFVLEQETEENICDKELHTIAVLIKDHLEKAIVKAVKSAPEQFIKPSLANAMFNVCSNSIFVWKTLFQDNMITTLEKTTDSGLPGLNVDKTKDPATGIVTMCHVYMPKIAITKYMNSFLEEPKLPINYKQESTL